MSGVQELFVRAGLEIPAALADWEGQVASWCRDHWAMFPQACLSEINVDFAVFVFDHRFERVTLAYAVSVDELRARDTNRIRGFPSVNATVRAALGDRAFAVDKGHFLGHVSGGRLDINLFPHRRELNRGWSTDGKRFRQMERYVAEHLGSFFYHRPLYDDETWIPQSLEYGVLMGNSKWWVATFRNK